MTTSGPNDVDQAILEMRDLLRLLAGPAIAERDQKRRTEIRKVVGASIPKAKSVLLMDGSRTQMVIHKEIGINQGQLSTLVKQLTDSGLLSSDSKYPKLAIVLPPNFFEGTK
jgi:hypothetical protein